MGELLGRSYWRADDSRAVEEATVGEALRRAAAEAPALVAGAPDPAEPRRWTYGELLRHAERAAVALLGRFDPGERVAIWANNVPEWVVLEYGAALAGVTIVTVSPALRAGELRHVLGHSRADGVFLTPLYRGTPMAEALAGVRADLPDLREAVSFSDWEEFLGGGSPALALPEVGPDAERRSSPDRSPRMPTRRLLSEAQRARPAALPKVGHRELTRHHTLSEADLAAISMRRGAANPLGFASSGTRAGRFGPGRPSPETSWCRACCPPRARGSTR